MTTEADALIASRTEFEAALRATFAELAGSACREVLLCDEDFAEWPLGDLAVVEGLSRWAASSRRLVLMARSFDEVARRHPRWVRWRRDWSHIVECRTNTELATGEFPSILLASGLATVRLSDNARYRGRVSRSKAEEVRCREQFDAVSQRSEPAFPATTTGL